MKNRLFFLCLFLLAGSMAFAQVGINSDNSGPDPSAMLDVKSTNRGFLPPRMTTEQMNSIITPLEGLLVYNTSVNSLFWFNGTTWTRFNEFSFTESDPVFMAHPANGITALEIGNWNAAYSNSITGASGTAPLSLTISNNQLSGSMPSANPTTSGYLTSTDWNSFNNKVSSQWTANGGKLYYNIGNIGIGTSNPLSKLDIAGNAVVGSTYSGTSTAPANGLLVEGQLGVGTTTLETTAAFEVTSSSRGVLLPRMTRAQRNAIASPAEGLMVYCTNCGTNGSLSIFTSGSWMTFSPCTVASPAAGIHVMSQGQVVWNWLPISGAAGYKWNTVADYETATDMAAATTKTETGTECDTTYTRYLWTYSSCGESGMATLTSTVPPEPATPTAATHVATKTSIVWKWHPVAGATGYKWGMTNDFALATDMGTDTTKTETGDTCGTAYTRFVWAYNGCGFSMPVTLTQSTLACWVCGQPITDSRDAQSYNTVMIGAQCWFKQNLNIGTMINNAVDQTNNSIIEKYCYSDDAANCAIYGGLYQWDEFMNYTASSNANPSGRQGICPSGWHIPSDAEWCQLETFLDATVNCTATGWRGTDVGGKMKEAGTSHWTSPNTGATNSSGFTALPGGLRYFGGGFNYLSEDTYLWSAAESSATKAWERALDYSHAQVYRGYDNKTFGFSGRCCKD